MPERVDVLSQAWRSRLVISTTRVLPSYSFEATPARDLQVYAGCRFAHAFPQGLEAGPLGIYEGGAFLRVTRLEATEAGQEVAIGLGSLPFFEVSRQQRQREQKLKDSGRRGVRISTRLAVTSTFPDQVEVRLCEALPQLQGDGGELVLLDSQPEVQRQGAVLSWRLQLIPGECQQIDYNYRVSYPETTRLEWRVQ